MKIHKFLNEDNWTQGTFARFKNGRPCSPLDKRAACFCLLGAAEKCYINRNNDVYFPRASYNRVINILEYELGKIESFPAKWNDIPGRTVKQVKALCKKLNV